MNFLQSIRYHSDPEFVAELRRKIRQTKVLHLAGIPETVDVSRFYEELVGELGDLLRKGETIAEPAFVENHWLDIRFDARQSHTFRHSNTRQPLHTDGAYVTSFPCDIVFLFCIQPAKQGGATVFLDGDELVHRLQRDNPDLLTRLESQPVTFSKGAMGRKTVPIVDRCEGSVVLNWNYYRAAAENPPEARSLVEEFREYLDRYIESPGVPTPVKLEEGAAVFFHDHQVLHGRTAFVGDRCLMKGVLNLNETSSRC